MGLFDVIASPIKSAIDIFQSGYNLYKDMNNVDVTRQKDAQMEINRAQQQQQFLFNKALAEQAHGFNMESQEDQQAFQQDMLQKQFNMNAVLGSAAREAMQQRAAGINPSAANSPTASVGLGSSSAPAQSPTQVSAPSSSVHTPTYSPSGRLASLDYMESSALVRKNDQETRLLQIEELFSVQKHIMDLEEKKSNIVKNMSEAYRNSAEGKATIAKLDDELEILRRQQKKLEQETNYYREASFKAHKEGEAAEKNAVTNEKAQQEQARHNLRTEFFEKQRVKLEGERVNFESDIAMAQVEELHARAEREFQEGKLTKAKCEHYGWQIFSEIYKNISLGKEALATARYMNMQADEYKALIASEIAKNYAETAFYSSWTMRNVITGVMQALSSKAPKSASYKYGKDWKVQTPNSGEPPSGYNAPWRNNPAGNYSDYGPRSW